MATEHPLLYQARRDLERATATREKAEASLQSAERDVARLRSFIEQYEMYIGENDAVELSLKWRFRSRTLTNSAVAIIEKSEDPLSIQDILERLSIEGIIVGGENKANNLAAYLSKDHRVRYERGVGWMPTGAAKVQESTQDLDDPRIRARLPETLVTRRRSAFASTGSDRERRRPATDALSDDEPF